MPPTSAPPPHRSPRVTIGIPVRDGSRYLAGCLDAVLGQTLADLEVVVSDNASEDDTEAICRDYAARDGRLRYVRQPQNLGAAENFNAVFGLARGGLFKWVAHDDVIEPDCVEACVAALDAAGPGAALAYPRTLHIDAEGAAVGAYDAEVAWSRCGAAGRLRDLLLGKPETLLTKCYPVFGLIRAEALRGTRLIQAFNSSDKVLLVELALRGDFVGVDRPLLRRRMHAGTSRSANVTEEAVAEWFAPRAGQRFPMPRWRLLRGYLDAVRRAPLPARDRLACLAVVLRWLASERNWRVVLGEFRIRARQRIGRARPALRREPEAAAYLRERPGRGE